MHRFFKVLGTSALLGMAVACGPAKDKVPSDIIPEKKMQAVFTDVLIAEAYISEQSIQNDSQKHAATRLYTEIFDKYHITKQEYFKSYDFYARHPALFNKNMGPVLDSLSAMEARLPNNAPSPPVPVKAPANAPRLVVRPGVVTRER